MFNKHYTKEGHEILIADMEDSHLNNFIQLQFKKISDMKTIANAEVELDVFQKTLYGFEDIDIETVAEKTRMIIEDMYPYLAEAFLRGMDGIGLQLGATLGRNARLSAYTHQLENVEVDDE